MAVVAAATATGDLVRSVVDSAKAHPGQWAMAT